MADRQARLAILATSITDGMDVDWEEAEAAAGTPEEHAAVRNLRLVSDIIKNFRDLPDPAVSEVSQASEQTPASEPLLGPEKNFSELSTVTAPVDTIGEWGHLMLLEKVGEGAYGEVYRAWEPRLDREVAVKLIRPETAAGKKVASSILEEGKLLARVRHPNVATVFGAETHDGRVGIWMEFIHGRTLSGLLKEQRTVGAREAALIGLELCGALAAVHAAGLVHGDVKAQNVMKEEGGRIVLMDFNAGQEFVGNEERSGGRVAGTPLYMAPEAFRGEPNTIRSDIYSLGVLLYQLVTGDFPVRARDIQGLRMAHEKREVKLLRDIRHDLPESFLRIVERALSRDPDKRFESAGSMQAALSRVLSTDGGTGLLAPPERVSGLHPPVADGKAKAGVWRWPVLSAGLAILLLAVLITTSRSAREWLLGTSDGSPIRSVAVLPIMNRTGDPGMELLADGITEALIMDLGGIKGFQKVTSRTSAFHFKDTDLLLPEIADKLGVDAILEGSVMLTGSRVQLAARLIDARNERHVWSDTYEDKIERVSGEIVQAIARESGIDLTSREKARLAVAQPVDLEALKHYQIGRSFIDKKSQPGMLTKAIEQFKLAIEIQPDYALGYAGVAEALIWKSTTVYGEIPPEHVESLERDVQAYAIKAVELDDGLAEGHTMRAVALLGIWFSDMETKWKIAEKEFSRALELNPSSAITHGWYAVALRKLGRFEEGIEHAKRAQDLDPRSVSRYTELGWAYEAASNQGNGLFYPYDRGFSEEKLAEFARLRLEQYEIAYEMDPDDPLVRYNRAGAYLNSGREELMETAIRELRDLIAQGGSEIRLSKIGAPLVLAVHYARTGEKAEARKLVESIPEDLRWLAPDKLAYIWILMGEDRRAIDLLIAAQERGKQVFLGLKVFDPIRSDPRFIELERRAGEASRVTSEGT